MQIFSKNHNSNPYAGISNSPAFKGANVDKAANAAANALAVAKCASNSCSGVSEVYNTLLNTTLEKRPDLLKKIDGVYLPEEETFSRKLVEAGRDFLELPLDWLDDIASHFPNSRINNLGILKKHRGHILAENRVKAFQGFYDCGSDILADESKSLSKLAEELDIKLNQSAEMNKSIYDSKKERFGTRMISGLTGALFLGNDFYNSAILKGKSEEDAEKAKRKKQGQEIKENIIEGLAQYGVMACFAKLSQSNIWFNVASGVGVSTVARILSRKMSGMRLTRMEAPEHSMNEFVKAAKNNETYKTQSERDKEAKKALLCPRNLILWCVGIISAGFALKKLGSSTTIGKNINKYIAALKEKSYQNSIEDIVARPYELQNMAEICRKYGEGNFADSIQRIVDDNKGETLIEIGARYKIKKLPGGLTTTNRALKKAALTPFSMVKEFITYPYKLASKLVDAIVDSSHNKKITAANNDYLKKIQACNDAKDDTERVILAEAVDKAYINLEELKSKYTKKKVETGSERLKDASGIKNIYFKYKDLEKKFGSDSEHLEEEFGKYVQKLRAASLNNQTASKLKNSEIGVLAGITGTLTGMWFNMNDEYNAAIRNGDNKQEAEKAARKRGLNKFARMTSQVAIFGALSKLFRAQYQGSLVGAGIIVAVSTVLTDTVSRLLTAMPTKKMNKAELEQYQENHKNGKMAWYYNLIDKLAS